MRAILPLGLEMIRPLVGWCENRLVKKETKKNAAFSAILEKDTVFACMCVCMRVCVINAARRGS